MPLRKSWLWLMVNVLPSDVLLTEVTFIRCLLAYLLIDTQALIRRSCVPQWRAASRVPPPTQSFLLPFELMVFSTLASFNEGRPGVFGVVLTINADMLPVPIVSLRLIETVH